METNKRKVATDQTQHVFLCSPGLSLTVGTSYRCEEDAGWGDYTPDAAAGLERRSLLTCCPALQSFLSTVHSV